MHLYTYRQKEIFPFYLLLEESRKTEKQHRKNTPAEYPISFLRIKENRAVSVIPIIRENIQEPKSETPAERLKSLSCLSKLFLLSNFFSN